MCNDLAPWRSKCGFVVVNQAVKNELLPEVVDAVLMSAVSSVSFLLEAVGDPKDAWGNMALLRTSLPQSVP
jgi:hypothetical protein